MNPILYLYGFITQYIWYLICSEFKEGERWSDDKTISFRFSR
jgi:hypothetical protein